MVVSLLATSARGTQGGLQVPTTSLPLSGRFVKRFVYRFCSSTFRYPELKKARGSRSVLGHTTCRAPRHRVEGESGCAQCLNITREVMLYKGARASEDEDFSRECPKKGPKVKEASYGSPCFNMRFTAGLEGFTSNDASTGSHVTPPHPNALFVELKLLQAPSPSSLCAVQPSWLCSFNGRV